MAQEAGRLTAYPTPARSSVVGLLAPGRTAHQVQAAAAAASRRPASHVVSTDHVQPQHQLLHAALRGRMVVGRGQRMGAWARRRAAGSWRASQPALRAKPACQPGAAPRAAAWPRWRPAAAQQRSCWARWAPLLRLLLVRHPAAPWPLAEPTRLGAVHALVALVQDQVGGLVVATQRALQHPAQGQQMSTRRRQRVRWRQMPRRSGGSRGGRGGSDYSQAGGRRTTIVRPSLVMIDTVAAAVEGQRGV